MTKDERELSAYQLLLKINVIVGWTIPAKDELMDILTDQFTKKLAESYADVNAEEIEYAFRNRGLEVKDWGKALNLTLIDEVMLPYLQVRSDLSKMEESKSFQMPTKIERDSELTVDEWEEWLSTIREYPLEFIPVTCYEYLIRANKINPNPKEKKDYIEKAIPIYIISLQKNNPKDLDEFIKQKEKGEFLDKFAEDLISISKKMIVKDFLQNSLQEVSNENS
jgi:hypothetical protein